MAAGARGLRLIRPTAPYPTWVGRSRSSRAWRRPADRGWAAPQHPPGGRIPCLPQAFDRGPRIRAEPVGHLGVEFVEGVRGVPGEQVRHLVAAHDQTDVSGHVAGSVDGEDSSVGRHGVGVRPRPGSGSCGLEEAGREIARPVPGHDCLGLGAQVRAVCLPVLTADMDGDVEQVAEGAGVVVVQVGQPDRTDGLGRFGVLCPQPRAKPPRRVPGGSRSRSASKLPAWEKARCLTWGYSPVLKRMRPSGCSTTNAAMGSGRSSVGRAAD